MNRLPAFFLAGFLAGCAAQPGGDGPAGPRPVRGVVLISIDTLRADHLGAYGYELPTSPFFDELAQRATLFENAIVQYPSTLTSHMSIFTGLYPAEHGVYPPDKVLPLAVETLPEVFQRHGFRTAGFTEGGYLQGRYGFRRGFDEYEARDRRGDVSRAVERTFAQGVRFLEDLGAGDRFFLFLHTYAVHAPYDPPEEYRDLFWSGPPPERAFEPTGPELSQHNARDEVLDESVRSWFEALYDASIRQTDDVLRGFFASLERLGLAGDVAVVVTSDHGEELQDHGKMNHTQLYEEIVRVPLLIVHPDVHEGHRYVPVVESVDLRPTLLALAGLAEKDPVSGHSLAAAVGRSAPAAESEGYSEVLSGQWSLYRHDGRRLTHLVVTDNPRGWQTRRARFDATAPAVAFEVRTYGEPRRLSLRFQGHEVAAAEIGTDWTPVNFDLPGTGKRTFTLAVPDCTVPDDLPAGRWRCYGFQVRGLHLGRVELFDVEADPGEVRDLSGEQADVGRSLVRRLQARRRAAASEAPSEELDEELESQLKALGYLN